MAVIAPRDLNISILRENYGSGAITPVSLLSTVMKRIAAFERRGVWIYVLNAKQIDAQLSQLEARRTEGKDLPLFGVPFAVKDNIDVAGVATTAGCPEFAYTPSRSADAVQRLCDAGAIVVGKTNLDQFATGLVGTRSPYGACENTYDPEWISGGSSSGSAVAVAGGLVSFALGTDTAGSGRVPAAFNNLVGLKPTRGLISTEGVVPACRSLDCVSIFATSCADAETVLAAASSEYCDGKRPASMYPAATFRCGVPKPEQLEFFGNAEARVLFEAAVARIGEMGGTTVPIDFAPFRKAAELLYEGPWVVERLLATGPLLKGSPSALRPELRTILESASRYTASDVFASFHTLAVLQRETALQWRQMDVMLLPTTGTIYRIAEVEADPMRLNRNLGFYTNFVNLLGLSAIAVPNAFLTSGLPMGVTFVAPARGEADLFSIGSTFHARSEKGNSV